MAEIIHDIELQPLSSEQIQVVKEFQKEMVEIVIPEIVATLRQRQLWAKEFRGLLDKSEAVCPK